MRRSLIVRVSKHHDWAAADEPVMCPRIDRHAIALDSIHLGDLLQRVEIEDRHTPRPRDVQIAVLSASA